MMEIEIAANGWQGAAWDHFYPDDIPDDWRLDYYANEFRAVVVPYREWALAADEVLLGWQEQVTDDFAFYWELSNTDTPAMARLQALLRDEQFAAHWGGVVDLHAPSPLATPPPALLRLQQNLALRPLRAEIEQALDQAGEPLLVVVEAAAAETLRAARDLALLLGGG